MPGLCSKNCCENSPRTPERGHAAITHQPPGVYPNTPGFLGESDISTGFRINSLSVALYQNSWKNHFPQCAANSSRMSGSFSPTSTRRRTSGGLHAPASCPVQSGHRRSQKREQTRPPHAGREAVPWYTRQSATAYQDTVRPSCLESRRKAKHRAPGLLPELEGQASRAGVRPAHPFLRLHCTGSKLSVVYQTTLNFVLPTPCSAHPFQ